LFEQPTRYYLKLSVTIKPFMRSRHIFFLTLSVILIYTCSSHDKGLYKFDPRTLKEREITLTQIADQITYIPLENKMLIGDIINIKIINEGIYFPIRDIGILVFNREGKFISKIGNIGRGPGEYISFLLFCVNDKSGTVYIVDVRNVIKVFSRTGKFIRSFSLNEYKVIIENIEFYNSNLFIQYAVEYKDANYDWIICDTLGNIIKKQNRHLPAFTTNWGGPKPIYMLENQLFYYNQFTDTVFSVLPDLTEKPSLIISPGDHRKPRSNLSIEQIISGEYLELIRIFETSHLFVISYNFNKKHFLSLIEKQNHESFLIPFEVDGIGGPPRGGLENDIDGGSSFFPKTYFTDQGREYLVGLQYPYQIKAKVATEEFKNATPEYPEKKKALEKLAYTLKETDNPVLMIVRLKR